jgi:hypothetical protein
MDKQQILERIEKFDLTEEQLIAIDNDLKVNFWYLEHFLNLAA